MGGNFKTNYENLSYRYTAYGSNDTLTYVSDDSTRSFIPGTLRAGIALGKKDKFTAGIDFVTTRWSKAKIPGANGYMADTRNLLIGVEFIPSRFDNFSYLKRMEYRIGAHIGNNYLILDGNQIQEYGLTAGLGFPMRRSLNKTNIFFDYTNKSGSIKNVTHTEDFFTLGVSLNFYDFTWFRKKKYY
jgi:hypothetical protein